MTDTNTTKFEERIAALRKSYMSSLPEKIGKLSILWEQAQNHIEKDEPLRALQLAAHTLAGSGATFGAISVSRLARELNDLASKLLELGRQPDAREQEHITELIAALQKESGITTPRQAEIDLPPYPPRESEKRVFIVEDDQAVAEQLATQLVNEQYTVETFTTLGAFKQAYRQQKPEAVIMDMSFPESSEGGAEAMEEVKQLYQPAPPLIFISVRNDMVARLAAVRAGASRYFPKPLDIEKLVHTLDGLTYRTSRIPYRVMIVDDDNDMAEYYAAILRDAGLSTYVTSKPLQVLDELDEWQPDVILMDVYMPGCTGLELAAVVRQDDNYATMPIVFLSSETDRDKQLSALGLGGDAYLSKPVRQQELLATIFAQVKRSRCLSRLKNELQGALEKNEIQRDELEKKEKRLRFSQYFANIGSWDLHFQSRAMYWSEKIAPLLGYAVDHEPTYEAFLAAIHPDDRQGLEAAIEACAANQEVYETEHRVTWPDGSVHWLLQKGDIIRDEAGEPIRMLGVVQDITRRKQLERDLATQKEFAVQANSAKSEFLSRMSHELRTPLNAIIGFAQLLESDEQHVLHEQQRDNLEEILKAGNHLLELIDEVLDLARIETGKMQLHLEEIPVFDVLLESYSMMIPMAESQRIQLEFKIEQCEDVIVNADRTKLKQVMFNLISNAIKYNRPDGKVCVSCEPSGAQRIRLSVSDTGFGIPKDRQSGLFKAFNRLGAEESDIEGTGIGLMISKKIVEMMGGELGFQSEQGNGTVFWVDMSSENEVSRKQPGKSQVANS